MSKPLEALRGLHILVAEDEYMIADELNSVLTDAGVEVVGPVPRVGEALEIARSGRHLDAAILDVNLADDVIWPVVGALTARGVPVVLATGLDADKSPAEYADLPRCEKPMDARAVARVLLRTLAAGGTSGTRA